MRPHPLIVVLFFLSGCAALIYEVVWFQMLSTSLGATSAALGILLACYMGGLCLGSLLLPIFLPRGWRPLHTYAFLEFGIGTIGLLILGLATRLPQFYLSLLELNLGVVPSRIVLSALLLLPPTMLMGATLPVIARWVSASPAAATSMTMAVRL